MLKPDFVFVDCLPIPKSADLIAFLKDRIFFVIAESYPNPIVYLGYGENVFLHDGNEAQVEKISNILEKFELLERPHLIQAISIDLHGIEGGQWLHDSMADHFMHATTMVHHTFETTAINRILEELFDEGPSPAIDIKAWLFWLQWTGLLLPALRSQQCGEGDIPFGFFHHKSTTNPR